MPDRLTHEREMTRGWRDYMRLGDSFDWEAAETTNDSYWAGANAAISSVPKEDPMRGLYLNGKYQGMYPPAPRPSNIRVVSTAEACIDAAKGASQARWDKFRGRMARWPCD